jgi:hypothetical protein
MKRLSCLAVVACLGICALGGTARADLITYTETATVTGSLGGTSFTNALVTITGTGDTAKVTGSSPIFTNPVTATLTVHGIGPGGSDVTTTFTDTIQVADNQKIGFGNPAAGFGDLTSNLALVFTNNSVFQTYDLKTSIAPQSGAQDTGGGSFSTNLGSFVIDSLGNGTFGATLATPAVPEPASLTLLGLGAVGMMGYAWRRRRQQAA